MSQTKENSKQEDEMLTPKRPKRTLNFLSVLLFFVQFLFSIIVIVFLGEELSSLPLLGIMFFVVASLVMLYIHCKKISINFRSTLRLCQIWIYLLFLPMIYYLRSWISTGFGFSDKMLNSFFLNILMALITAVLTTLLSFFIFRFLLKPQKVTQQ